MRLLHLAYAILLSTPFVDDERVKIDYSVSNATLIFLPGVPPLTGIEATGRVTGRTASVNATRGTVDLSGGHKLNVSEVQFVAPDTSRKPTPASVVARVTGSLESVGDLLARDALKTYGGMHLDTSAMKGQLDGKLTIDMKLAKETKPSDTSVRVAAAVSNFSIEKLIGKERFEQGVLNVVVDQAGLKASGQGRLMGGAANLEIKRGANGNTDALVQFTIDDAARAKMGFSGAGVTGPIGVKVMAPFGKENAPAQVDLDLAKSAIDGLLPGFVKPAGRPAKASFVIDPSRGSVSVDQLVFEAPNGASARGALELDAHGAFRSAKFTSLRLSPGDDMRVEAEQTKDILKLTVRGTSIDARPFLRGVTGAETGAPGGGAGGGKDTAKDIEIDLKTALATGNNRQSLSGVDLKLVRRGGVVRSFQFQASSGRAPISGGFRGGGAIMLTSNDGGALLSFFDIYRRMEGGRLLLNARLTEAGVEGAIDIKEFVLRNEPALRRLITEGVSARDERTGQISRIDTNAATFQRLSATFTKGGGRFVVRDGVLVGQEIGLKLDGALDTARDQINMTGVFVPAFGVNNMFSKIPLFGPLLTGDRNEGLFAVNFRISGSASAPNLSISPLSVIAPGFLRKIFGVIDGTTPTMPQQVPHGESDSPSQNTPLSIAPGGR